MTDDPIIYTWGKTVSLISSIRKNWNSHMQKNETQPLYYYSHKTNKQTNPQNILKT